MTLYYSSVSRLDIFHGLIFLKLLYPLIVLLYGGAQWQLYLSLKRGIVGDGYSIRVHEDRWIPNHPTNKVLYPASEDTDGMLVVDLLDPDLHCWRRELITSLFHTDDAEAICSIPLSHRHVPDILLWMYNKNGMFSVKSAYRVAVQIQKGEKWAENSSGYAGK